MIKILVADDHTIVREGLKQIVAETHDMIVADEASNGQEVLSKVRKMAFDIIVLDISMPGRSGLDILKQLKHQRPKLPVLILSIHPEDQYAIRVLKAGASGYLTKESSPDELITAIRKVSLGGKYITSSLSEMLASSLDIDFDKSIHKTLSDREYQVMCLIASGKKIKEIAEKLSLSVSTINTYRFHIMRKMNMKNNSELIYYAIKHELID
ncbi:response regulator transcription factor [candidate division WOR-3 bacterium]|nr:response regulator transcription factor [candidate division WOR-3 bacterium]